MAEDFDLVQRLPFLMEICLGKKVLHLGCTNYPYTAESIENDMLLHFELERAASEIYGIDFEQDGLDILAKHGTANLFRGDLEKLDELDLDEEFEVIIAGEIIEHLNNPGLFLSGIKRFMNPGTRLVVTTVNAYSAMRFFQYGLRGKGGRQENVHPDHVAYYSYSTLSLILRRHGFDVEKFLFYDLGHEHRPHLRRIWSVLNDISVKIAPQWSDGVIAVCRL